MSRKKSETPTALELNVMKVLWDKGESLTINEVSECMNQQGEGISVASVAQVMKKLLEKNMVKVCEHKLVSNVYARTFEPVFKREDYIGEEITRLRNVISVDKRVSTMGIFQTLLRNPSDTPLEEEDLEELDQIIKEYRERIAKEKR